MPSSDVCIQICQPITHCGTPANHQENKRSRVNKSEFVPQNEGNNCMICKNWSLALRCKVKLKRKSKNIVIRKNNVARIFKKKMLCEINYRYCFLGYFP